MNMTVDESRDPVRVFHFHLEETNRGGATLVYDTRTGDFGLALCCQKDHFSRRLGRKIATNRLNNREIIGDKAPKMRFPLVGRVVADTPGFLFACICELVTNAAEVVGNGAVKEAVYRTIDGRLMKKRCGKADQS